MKKTFIEKIISIKSKNKGYIAKKLYQALVETSKDELLKSYDMIDIVLEKFEETGIKITSKKLMKKISEIENELYS